MSHYKCNKDSNDGTIKMDVLLNAKLLFNFLYTILECIYENIFIILVVVVLYHVLKLFYRAYVNPVLIRKELTDVGFDHIPRGPDRDLHIARAQASRKMSNKIPPPYPNGWFALAESRDLRVGDVVAVDALGQNFCVYRGGDGKARCVDAFCPHLGAHLAVGGTVRGNCIECPFHQWTFDEDGTCVYVPGVEKAPKGVSIKKWRSEEADGAVWVWYDAEGREPLWGIQVLPEVEGWGYRGRNEYIVACHIQEIPENGADPAHLNVVHSESILTYYMGQKYTFLKDIIGCHVWSADWTRGDDHTANITLTHDYRILGCNIGHVDANITQIGPGQVRLFLQSVIGPLFISQSVTPLGPLLQKVVHRFYSPFSSAIFATVSIKTEGEMIERDAKIWNNKLFLGAPAYVRTDKTIRAFRSWFSQFYTENSVTYRDAVQNTLDW